MKKKVLITGATGLIGSEIVKLCHSRNIDVNYLTTSKEKITNESNYKGFYWNPNERVIDQTCLEDVDAIINLVGASISERWTDSYKEEIIKSRTLTAQLLKSTIEKYKFEIDHIVSASAIGVYPDSKTNYYEENFHGVSSSFLGTVVEKWEDAIDEFKALDMKVSKVRIGLVLADEGGALPEIVKPMKFGAGAAFGSGKQWQSWIHIKDLARIFIHIVEKQLEGVYNGVAPNPVTNQELTKSAAEVLNKPLLLPNIPKFAMKLALGEMHIILFESQRVSSRKIEDTGFDFKFHHLTPALNDLLT